jgi:hypothetical protein
LGELSVVWEEEEGRAEDVRVCRRAGTNGVKSLVSVVSEKGKQLGMAGGPGKGKEETGGVGPGG